MISPRNTRKDTKGESYTDIKINTKDEHDRKAVASGAGLGQQKRIYTGEDHGTCPRPRKEQSGIRNQKSEIKKGRRNVC